MRAFAHRLWILTGQDLVTVILVLTFVGFLAAVALGEGPVQYQLTAPISAAEHEVDEGYFALGSTLTVTAKPGTDLQRFLARHNGQSVRITLTVVKARELQSLERGGEKR